MTEREMLTKMVERHGPTATARMIGVHYQTLWGWVRKGLNISSGSLTAIRLLWERENPNG